MFCTSCGTKNPTDSHFCKQCGHKLEAGAPQKISEEAYDRALPDEEQVLALLERAYRRRKENNLAAAIALCEEALRLRPESTSAHSMLAQLYEQNGDVEKAIPELEYVLRMNPGSIADRVKLDEMRDGVRPRPSKVVSSRIALVEPEAGSLTRMVLSGGGIVAVIVLAVMTTYVMMRLNQPAPQPNNGPSRNAWQPGGTATANQPGAADRTGTDNAGQVASAKLESDANSIINPFSAVPPFYSYPSQPQYPANYRYPPPSGYQRPDADVRRVADNPTKRRNSGPQSTPGVRVHLNGEGGDVDPGENVIVPVNSKTSVTKNGSGSKKTNDLSGGNIVEPMRMDKSAGTGAGPEARGLIALAADKKLKEDYTAAITAYRKALPTAGDDSGFIYQQIAFCYQRKGEKSSAISNYQSAINEYKRLVDSGRQVDKAKDGIRVSERGINVCQGD